MFPKIFFYKIIDKTPPSQRVQIMCCYSIQKEEEKNTKFVFAFWPSKNKVVTNILLKKTNKYNKKFINQTVFK